MVRIRRRLLIIRFALAPRVVDDDAELFFNVLLKLLLLVVAADSGMVERVGMVDMTL